MSIAFRKSVENWVGEILITLYSILICNVIYVTIIEIHG